MHLHVFPPFLQRVTTSVIFDCPRRNSSKMGPALKGKNLLPLEQILSFMSLPLWKKEARNEMAELFPSGVHGCTSMFFHHFYKR